MTIAELKDQNAKLIDAVAALGRRLAESDGRDRRMIEEFYNGMIDEAPGLVGCEDADGNRVEQYQRTERKETQDEHPQCRQYRKRELCDGQRLHVLGNRELQTQ